MIVRNTQPTKPASRVKVKRRVYLDLLQENVDMRAQMELMEKYQGFLKQAVAHMEQSEDEDTQELARHYKEEAPELWLDLVPATL